MTTRTMMGLVAILMGVFVSGAEKPDITVKSKETLESEKILNDFLLEFDEGSIKKNYSEAVSKNAALKKISTALPPRTPDLFASGLFVPYEDNHGIYHDFDRIFFKVKDGNWNLTQKEMVSAVGHGMVFTKEIGLDGGEK